MSRTRLFREQHRDLAAIGARLGRELGQPHRAGVRSLVSELAGTLRVHLAMEDQRLYPKLVMSRDEAIAATARTIHGEVGELRDAAEAYFARWPSDRDIESRRADFDAETRAILEALGRRIALEDDELFPLLDGVDDFSEVTSVPRTK